MSCLRRSVRPASSPSDSSGPSVVCKEPPSSLSRPPVASPPTLPRPQGSPRLPCRTISCSQWRRVWAPPRSHAPTTLPGFCFGRANSGFSSSASTPILVTARRGYPGASACASKLFLSAALGSIGQVDDAPALCLYPSGPGASSIWSCIVDVVLLNAVEPHPRPSLVVPLLLTRSPTHSLTYSLSFLALRLFLSALLLHW